MTLSRWSFVCVSCLALVVPHEVVTAAEGATTPAPGGLPAERSTSSADVRLGPGGTLVGQVVNPQGRATVSAPVALWSEGRPLAGTITDRQGWFRFRHLARGTYVVAVGEKAVVCRLWEPAAAPPAAGQALLLTLPSETVRGQGCLCEGVEWLFKHPILTSSLIAAAIAVPIATSAKEASPASP